MKCNHLCGLRELIDPDYVIFYLRVNRAPKMNKRWPFCIYAICMLKKKEDIVEIKVQNIDILFFKIFLLPKNIIAPAKNECFFD